MEKKLWSNAEVVELGVEETKDGCFGQASRCTVILSEDVPVTQDEKGQLVCTYYNIFTGACSYPNKPAAGAPEVTKS